MELRERELGDTGATLFATRRVLPGEIVFRDTPFLTLPMALPPDLGAPPDTPPTDDVLPDESEVVAAGTVDLYPQLEAIAHAAGVAPASLYGLVTYAECTPQQMEEVEALRLPDLDACRAAFAPLYRAAEAVCALPFLQCTPRKCYELLVRFRASGRLVTRDGEQRIGLYTLSSMARHSCRPNMVCLSDDTTLHWRAIAVIEEGEELTTSLLPDTHMWKCTPTRQAYLLRRQFISCQCSRCVAPDTARTMKCPRCTADTCVYTPADNRWCCSECQGDFSDGDVPLHSETLIRQHTASLFGGRVVKPSGGHMHTLRHSRLTLGDRHWLTVELIYAILVRWLDGEEKLSDPAVVSLAQELAEWFQRLLPDMHATASMCHFAGTLIHRCSEDEGDRATANRLFGAAHRIFVLVKGDGSRAAATLDGDDPTVAPTVGAATPEAVAADMMPSDP